MDEVDAAPDMAASTAAASPADASPAPDSTAAPAEAAPASKAADAEEKSQAAKTPDELAAEEDIDLSKEIPVVPQPKNSEYAARNKEVDEKIAVLKERRNVIQQEINDINDSSNSANSEFGRERAVMNGLRQEKDRLVAERKAIYDARNAAQEVLDRSQTAMRKLRSDLKFTNIEDIEAEISKLRYKQETESMSLAAEKNLLKDIEALQASKKVVAQFTEQQSAVKTNRDSRESYKAQIDEKNKELNEITARIQEQREVMNKISESNTARQRMPELVKQRNDIKKEMDECYAQKKAIYAEQTEAWNAHKKYLALYRRQQQYRREEERKQREEEEKARKEAWLEEQMKKMPYEEEQNLCDFLVSHLEGLQKAEEAKNAPAAGSAAPETKQDDSSTMDIGGGQVLTSKKGYDDDLHQFVSVEGRGGGGGGGKKKRNRRNRGGKNGAAKGAGMIRHSMETLGEFAHLELSAPGSIADIPASIEELIAKKEWYSKQPRKIPEYPGDRRRGRGGEGGRGDAARENGAPSGSSRRSGARAAQPLELDNSELFPTLPGAPQRPAVEPEADEDPADTTTEDVDAAVVEAEA